jgi:hypothetical protein
VASKLNWFTTTGEYKLPSPVTISPSFSFLNIDSQPNQYNWLDYYKDSIKTYQFTPISGHLDLNIDDLYQVNFSSTFTQVNPNGYNSITFSSSNMTQSNATGFTVSNYVSSE